MPRPTRNEELPVILKGFEISLAEIREALLFAVANGWRPAKVAPAGASFPDDEAPTTPYIECAVLP